MNPKTKTYIKVGLGLVITGISVYFIYKFIDKKITERKLRQAKFKEDEEQKQKDENVTTISELKSAVGKIAYAKGEYVNVRSSQKVDNGYNNNFIGKVEKGTPVGKIMEANIVGDKVWYKVGVIGSNLKDDKELGKAKKSSTTGYIREDAIIFK